MRPIDANEIRIKPEYMHDICGSAMIRVEDVARIINEMPTINPQPRKKGKWQWCGNHHLCSECDEWALTRWDEDECDEVDILTDYCPNCGADMRECEEE